MNGRRDRLTGLVQAILTILLGLAVESRADFVISINPGPGLAGNAQAMAAFDAAAREWSSRITTNMTVRIDADLRNLGNASIIGQAESTVLATGFDEVRDAMAAHGGDGPNLGILAALPTAAQFVATLPAGVAFSGNMSLSQANAKALGLSSATTADAIITFNTQFSFAYTPGQLTSATVDFQTVAAHEIGHALGFLSEVDTIDEGETSAFPAPLDLFRFAAGNAPTTADQFRAFQRELRPGRAAVTSDTLSSLPMSTGRIGGDGYQASHWKQQQLNGNIVIGVMDPALPNNTVRPVGVNDLRAIELIGYTLAATVVPEPGSAVLLGLGLASLLLLGRVARPRASPGS